MSKVNDIKGDVAYVTDTKAATVTVHSLVEAFDSFTVGVPEKKVVFSCGHWFNTGADDERLEDDPTLGPMFKGGAQPQRVKAHYHCIKCQKLVEVVSWEE